MLQWQQQLGGRTFIKKEVTDEMARQYDEGACGPKSVIISARDSSLYVCCWMGGILDQFNIIIMKQCLDLSATHTNMGTMSEWSPRYWEWRDKGPQRGKVSCLCDLMANILHNNIIACNMNTQRQWINDDRPVDSNSPSCNMNSLNHWWWRWTTMLTDWMNQSSSHKVYM